MKLLYIAKRFLKSDDGASGLEQVVMVGCTVILCMTIQINSHRHAATSQPVTGGKPWHSASLN
jgi:hypothetical protein